MTRLVWLCAWLVCSVADYGLTYAGVRHAQVNDWPLSEGSRPHAYRSAHILSASLAVTGPLGVGGVFFLQAIGDFPGWHVHDWPELQDGDDR